MWVNCHSIHFHTCILWRLCFFENTWGNFCSSFGPPCLHVDLLPGKLNRAMKIRSVAWNLMNIGGFLSLGVVKGPFVKKMVACKNESGTEVFLFDFGKLRDLMMCFGAFALPVFDLDFFLFFNTPFTRIVLAAALWQHPHILILDELGDYVDSEDSGCRQAGSHHLSFLCLMNMQICEPLTKTNDWNLKITFLNMNITVSSKAPFFGVPS